MKVEAAKSRREGIMQLLSSVKLPVEDLPEELSGFFVVSNIKDVVIGIIGLEIYENYGLLRSLAVDPEYRNLSIATKLLITAESYARLNKLKAVYLLTEIATAYFHDKGYEQISRADAPPEIQASSEFSHICPLSATVMKKNLI
jgi:amino-acid N-acetyltransferase